VATCRLSFARLAPTALAARVLIMTSFVTDLPRPPLQSYGHLTVFNI